MIAPFYLVLYIYAGALSSGDSVAIQTIPQPSQQSCEAVGKAASALVKGSFKELRFVCVKGQ